MILIDINDGKLKVTLQGWDKIWALKSYIEIPLNNIVSVQPNIEIPKGCRMPGTCVPGLITAGTLVSKRVREFWCVNKRQNAISIHLKNEVYAKLILELPNRDEAIQYIQNALKSA